MKRVLSSVLFALSCAACDLTGGAVVDRAPHAKEPIDAAMVAADPCRYGDLNRCADRCSVKNDAPSCNTVGVMLELSEDSRASRFYRASCAGNYAPGCNNLAWLYLLGRGVPRDRPLSIALFTKAYDGYRVACSEGDVEACVMIREGRVDGDESEATAMLTKACESGFPKACTEVTR